jgi:hypothetical protein
LASRCVLNVTWLDLRASRVDNDRDAVESDETA